MKNRPRSEAAFSEALRWIPGGVNSPVRAFQAVGGKPICIAKAKGSRIFDVDGNEYLDLVGSWGPMILGHAYPPVLEAVESVLRQGTSFGAPTQRETELARRICEAMPSVEKVRLTNSGTEAAATAIRLARGFTRRDLLVKFAGNYHGHVDSLLVEAGSGALTGGRPDSAGVPNSLAESTLVLEYNDAEAVERVLAGRGREIAAVLVEPVAANMGVVSPKPDFLPRLRAACDRAGTVLIFDEVITGFRLGLGGAQEKFAVRPDLTILGKIIGGGLPVGAVGGRAEILDLLAPLGPVYHAGTLAGNPLAVAAGIVSLEALKDSKYFARLEALGERLELGLRRVGQELPYPITVNRAGSLLTVFFAQGPVRNLRDAKASRTDLYPSFFWKMIEQGIYLPPSNYEAFFLSTAHSEAEVDRVIEASREALTALAP